jgi:uncharacterized protein (TIGR02444 family)
MQQPELDTPLWRYAVKLYRHDTVRTSCLQLQEETGVDANQLLLAAWLATLKRTWQPSQCQLAQRSVARWRESVVLPLRQLRRQLQAWPLTSTLRDNVLAAEIQAEQWQLAQLFVLQESWRLPMLPSVTDCWQQNITTYAQQFGTQSEAASTLWRQLDSWPIEAPDASSVKSARR